MSHSQSDEELFEQVIHLATPAARRALLDQACADDPERRQHLEELLHAHELAGSFLVAPADPSEKTQRSGRSEEPGIQIGRYKLLQQIGEGGFGSVWMAEQREPVRRRVALKVIKLGMDTRQVIARFEAERQALALMDHPNIAKVLDAGSTETGRPFFVMELVRGVPILDYCDTEKLDTARRLQLFIQVCHAIQHAHQKGIIHRDIKPSNVMVTLHDGAPVPKVIDFGIAKATNTELTTKTLFTQHRQMIGTPAYMSPEQAEMSGLDIDTRSDIYSLGVLLYELLTGTTPFDAKELLSKGFAEIMRIIREVEPPKPSTRLSTLDESASRTAQQRHTDVRKLGILLRGDLDWIVMKCLEKDRTRRYETANGLAMDIRRHLSDEPVVAGPPSRSYRLHKFIRRNRAQVIAAGLVVAALLLGIAGTTWGMLAAIKQRARVTAQAQRASDALRQVTDEYKAKILADAKTPSTVPIVAAEGGTEVEALARTAVNLVRSLDASSKQTQRELTRATEVKRLITEMFRGVSPEEARGADITLLKKILDETAARLDNGDVKDELIAAELHDVIGVVYRHLGLYSEAERHLPVAVGIRSRALGEEHADTLASVNHLAVLRWNQAQFSEAERLFWKVLDAHERALGTEHPDRLGAMSNLALVFRNQARYAEAEALLVQVLAARKQILPADHPHTLDAMSNLAGLYCDQGRYTESEALYKETLETRRQILGNEHPVTLRTMNNLALVYVNCNRNAEAESLLVEALERRRRVLGLEHPRTLESMDALANVYSGQGRWTDAETLMTESLKIRKRVLGEDAALTLGAMNNLANLYMAHEQYDRAEALYLETLDIKRRSMGPENPSTLGTVTNLGILYNLMQRYDEAAAMFETSLPVMRRVLVAQHPWTGNAIRGLAKAYSALGRSEDARALYAELLQLQLAEAEVPDADANALNNAAWALLTFDAEELRDPQSALRYAQRACGAEEARGGANLWTYLDTLALAQHRTGDTASAIRMEQQAISLIPDGAAENVVAEMRANLSKFEAALASTTQPESATSGERP